MLTDSHAHLDMLEEDLDGILQRAREAGVRRIITIGVDLESSSRAVRMAERLGGVFAAVGFHPHDAADADKEQLEALSELALHPRVVAWGEIGLDFYRRLSPPDRQEEVFRAQLERAGDLGLPVVIHDRDAHDEVLSILRRMGAGPGRGVIHCFSGDLDLAMAFIDLGYYISIPGTVTFPNAARVRETAKNIPLERLLVETDAPFLSPVPMRGKRNEPAYVRWTALEIARLRGIPLDEVARLSTENAARLFGLNSDDPS